MQRGIFISYRRDDSEGFARSIFLSLSKRFGAERVFMDVEDIELGLDFVDAIEQSLSSCGVLLVLIGRDWLTCEDGQGQRRLDDPNDFVRMEVATALKSDLRVIPVCVRGAHMPSAAELPEDLQALSRKQALVLNHNRWDADIDKLVSALEKTLGLDSEPADAVPPPPKNQDATSYKSPNKENRPTQKRLLPALGLVGAIVIGGGIYQFSELGPDTHDLPPYPTPPIRDIPQPHLATDTEQPETPGSQQPAAPSPEPELIGEAQELLAELGYSPGPADGQMGRRTAEAIEAFQRDHGINVDGAVSAYLIQSLNKQLAEKEYAQPSNSVTPANVPVTGGWFDNQGFLYQFAEQGNQIGYQTFQPLTGMLIGQGGGTRQGNRIEYRWQTIAGEQGYGMATLDADGIHLHYQATDFASGLQSAGTLHKEHQPH